MFIKILRSFVVCVLFFSTEICTAFSYDIEPHLISDNLRLAAMGNLDLIVEDFNNELNAYDFGQSPAGIIEDDNGASYVYLPGLIGFTVFGDTVYDRKWSGYGFSLRGVFKVKSKFAIGGSYSETIANEESESWIGLLDGISYNNYYDTLVIGYTIIPQFSVGFRFSYANYTVQTLNSSYSYFDQKTYAYEPSILFNSPNKQWNIGLSYGFSKYESYDAQHKIIVPVIYSHGNLDLGIVASYHTFPNEDAEKSIRLRSLYRIPMRSNHIDVGCLFRYITPNVTDEGYRFYVSNGWQINWGIGIAFVADNIGLLGVQYRDDIIAYTGYISLWSDSYTFHETYISIGAEFNPLKVVPLRVGYVSHDSGLYGIKFDIITSGIGFILFRTRLLIDFAYNYKVLHYNSSLEPWYMPSDKDHIFALSGRVNL
jgi:hypothetical protein